MAETFGLASVEGDCPQVSSGSIGGTRMSFVARERGKTVLDYCAAYECKGLRRARLARSVEATTDRVFEGCTAQDATQPRPAGRRARPTSASRRARPGSRHDRQALDLPTGSA